MIGEMDRRRDWLRQSSHHRQTGRQAGRWAQAESELSRQTQDPRETERNKAGSGAFRAKQTKNRQAGRGKAWKSGDRDCMICGGRWRPCCLPQFPLLYSGKGLKRGGWRGAHRGGNPAEGRGSGCQREKWSGCSGGGDGPGLGKVGAFQNREKQEVAVLALGLGQSTCPPHLQPKVPPPNPPTFDLLQEGHSPRALPSRNTEAGNAGDIQAGKLRQGR